MSSTLPRWLRTSGTTRRSSLVVPQGHGCSAALGRRWRALSSPNTALAAAMLFRFSSSRQKAVEGRKGAQGFYLNPVDPVGVEGGYP
jgi:hypothetical protein